MNIRRKIEEYENSYLNKYAKKASESKGRIVKEDECDIRTVYQRDRDRIIHSKSFRRLKHKTQVFIAPKGDHYRTRLTHTLEVAQIARTIGCALRLNENLIEAIALAHDLGHTPFGHAGEIAFSDILNKPFKHVEQSMKVVKTLEKDGKGLNLTYEVLEGIYYHSKGRGPLLLKNDVEDVSLETMVVRLSDIIAYINHDIDDATRAGILDNKDIPREITSVLGCTHGERIDRIVKNIITKTINNNYKAIDIDDDYLNAIVNLRDFLFKNVYESKIIKKEIDKAVRILIELYRYYIKHLEDIPTLYIKVNKDKTLAIIDYIAGMTDRYALYLYDKFYIPKGFAYF
ncbi:MAG: deoxyguanosinetriphosphate triphosphohydrolase [Deferribacterota bacterium]|nr:deoxyguanosinetriphosphate triphosphohydrolase [Deferribacterota bacterium]